MNLKKNKCPLCGNKMKEHNRDMICQECGYRASLEISHPGSHSTGTSGYSGHTPPPSQNTTNRSPQTIRYSYEQDHASPSASKSFSNKTKNIWKKFGAINWILSIITIVVIICLNIPTIKKIASTASDLFADSEQTNETYAAKYKNLPKTQRTPSSNQNYPSTKTTTKPSKKTPESKVFCQFISTVFQKSYKKVTPKELAQITTLTLTNSDEGYKVLCYTLQSGESGNFYLNNSSIDTSDLSCFRGLKCLNWGRESLNPGDLDGLDKLTELWCCNTPSELVNIVNPKQLNTLGLKANVFLSDIKAIETFSNLTKFHLDCSYLTEISPVSSLKKLKILELEDGDRLENFQVLYHLPGLESLSIDSKKLRDIGFVANMPSLTELSIQNSSILQIQALNDCKETLQKLNLSNNYQVTDYQIVSELRGLTELTLFITYSFENPQPLPELGNMPNLTYLSISNYDDLSQIANAQGLQELTLSGDYAHDFSSLQGLSKLTRLNLLDMSLEPSSFEPLMELSQLESIHLCDSFIWGNVEKLLSLPSLKEFNLNDCTTGLDIKNLVENTSLERLHMSHVKLKSLIDGKWDYNANNENNLNLADHTELFQYFPNLKELYLAGNRLTDLSFAQNLSQLQILDITDNYITSLVPLAKLSQLEAILCATNSIADEAGLGRKLRTQN